jgi:Protein of unknown function (DUF3800)
MLRHSMKPWEIAVFTVYFDESGTHRESETAVAACLIARDDSWEALTGDWEEARLEAGFDDFHMADFIMKMKPPYSSWDDAKRERVYRKLARIIGKHIERGYSVAVSKAAFDAHVSAALKSQVGEHHYTFAIRTCIGNMRQWRLNNGGNFQFVFDWMDKGKSKTEVANIYDKLDVAIRAEHGLPRTRDGWGFQHKEDFPPLQAADIFAWNVYNATVNRVIAKEAKPSRWLFMLREYVSQPLSIGVFDEGKIKTFSEEWEQK